MSTFQQLLYHVVFSTKGRKQLLKSDDFRRHVLDYLKGTIQHLAGVPIAKGAYYDHVHLLVEIPAKTAVSRFVGQLKAHTSKHVNESMMRASKFAWQEGYAAFSVSYSQRPQVDRYIAHQLEHHRSESFQQEFLHLLEKHQIDYDINHVFD